MSHFAAPGIIELIGRFTGEDLTRTLAGIETSVRGLTETDSAAFVQRAGAGREVLAAAGEMKRLSGQINVTIHALGILLCLPHILEPGEIVESVSLGAGNTGRMFDLETNFRVAEFKFITWRGGSETIRQNGVFKDFMVMAEHETTKRKYLYLLGTEQALRFFRGGRALASVLSKDTRRSDGFKARHGDQYKTVGDYFAQYADTVTIVDVSQWLSELALGLVAAENADVAMS